MTKYFKDRFAVYGDATEIPDSIQSNGSVSYQQGFTVDYQRRLGTDPLAKPFPRQGFNGLMGDITGAIQQYQQYGFFDFITPEINGGDPFKYAVSATVRYDMSDSKDGSDVRNFTSLINDNAGNPKDNPDDWRELGEEKGYKYGYLFESISSSTVLKENQAGVILIDASAGPIDITLPETKENIGFILKRIDSSLNTVKVKVSGTDKIKYNLLINANGYSFFNLFGAGDYWHVVSDGNGSWYDLNRADKTALGTISYQSSTIVPEGGYVVANGFLLSRAEFPYLWDYAQKSGLLVEESNFIGNEGCFSTGDGATTFRVPDLRSTFLRGLDNDKGIDSGRTAGSWQKGSLSFVDTGSAGVWGSYDTTRTDPIEVALKKAGLDSFKLSDYQGIRMAGAGAASVVDLPGAGGDLAYAGLSRPNNIAYPIYLKII